MTPDGELQFHHHVKEPLLEDMERQTGEIDVTAGRVTGIKRDGGVLQVELDSGAAVPALRVIVAIGRSGNFRKLGAPGEELDKVHNRLHDPKDYDGRNVLVVGGGDSALETAIALSTCGAQVTLSYRKDTFSRPKPENIEKLSRLAADPADTVDVEEPSSERVTVATGPYLGPSSAAGSLRLEMGSTVQEVRQDSVVLSRQGARDTEIPNDTVFAMLGREAPLDFFRRIGVHLRGETRGIGWVPVIGFFLAVFLLYDWKSDGFMCQWLTGLKDTGVFPNNVPGLIASLGDWWAAQVADRATLIGTLAVSMKGRSFYYTLLYTVCVGGFGLARIRRRRTPYVTVQTVTLFLVQLFPLFLLPELFLPWLGYNGMFDAGIGGALADSLFEKYIPHSDYLAGMWPDWGHPRAYWRSYGFILAWPLSVYNVFTSKPILGWLIISFAQTFVIIPLIVLRWGKGAYCGWICSCGGLAETMGDTLREKMPHGPRWNRLNMVGQLILAVAFAMLAVRVLGWLFPGSWMNTGFNLLLEGKNQAGVTVNPLSWKWAVDIFIAGVLGVGLYVKASGRVWCRFACPLAALMHLYARFGRFRIFADKKKCISCNVCTSVCHQGIDVMNFANKGLPMADPQCVRCSACVQSCPTGVLTFGRVDGEGNIAATDRLAASLVQIEEA
jgi:thioredoxin reductase/ferredoxin